MLIVSCQAEENSPFNSPEKLNLFAQCAILEGVHYLRVEGIDNIKYIHEYNKSNKANAVIIGLVKSKYDNGLVKITRNEDDVKAILKYTAYIAIDGTFRKDNGMTGPEFIKYIKSKYNCLVIADVSNLKEAQECLKYTDFVSTALSGYTSSECPKTPNYELIQQIRKLYPGVYLIAEGRYNTPEQAANAIKYGATAVCVGSAITRPQNIINWYKDEINKAK